MFSNLPCGKVWCKIEILKFETKMPDLSILGQTVENNIVMFEISNLEFVKLQNFAKKQKWLHLGPKIPYLDILFWNLKTILSNFKSAPWNLSNCKVS